MLKIVIIKLQFMHIGTIFTMQYMQDKEACDFYHYTGLRDWYHRYSPDLNTFFLKQCLIYLICYFYTCLDLGL